MILRDLIKMNSVNLGNRSLFESVLAPEVIKALQDWKKIPSEGVLIGGLALSYYVKPRMTVDCDFLFIDASKIPDANEKFKRHRNGAFLHKETHVEVEVLAPSAINMPVELAQKIIETAIETDGLKVASKEGLVASKLLRFKLQDRADIEAILELGPIDLSDWPLTDKQQTNLETALEDFNDV